LPASAAPLSQMGKLKEPDEEESGLAQERESLEESITFNFFPFILEGKSG